MKFLSKLALQKARDGKADKIITDCNVRNKQAFIKLVEVKDEELTGHAAYR